MSLAMALSAVAGQAEINAAKNAVRSTLKDPGSAQFQNVIELTRPNANGVPTKSVCGEVNAKNGFGGYTGYKPFYYAPDMKKAVIGGTGDDFEQRLALTLLQRFCI